MIERLSGGDEHLPRRGIEMEFQGSFEVPRLIKSRAAALKEGKTIDDGHILVVVYFGGGKEG